jgi:HEAT repeat protein
MRSPRWTKFAPAALLAAGLLALAVTSDGAFAADKAKEAEKYAQDLKTGKDAKTKVAALNELGKLGQLMSSFAKPAVPDMIEALKDKETTVRAAAAKNLGLVDPDPKTAVPALVDLMKNDKEESVRMAAIQGLGAMGPSAKPANKDINDLVKSEGKDSKLTKAANNARKSINPKN